MIINILDKTKKKEILDRLSYLGKLKTNALFIKTGDRVRAFTGNLSIEEILKIWKSFMIEGIGLYIAKDFLDKKSGISETRLSIDGVHFFKDQINSNIIELNDEQKEKWFRGNAVELTKEQKEKYKELKGFVVLKHGEDFIGTAKLTEKFVLYNYLPKERRIRG